MQVVCRIIGKLQKSGRVFLRESTFQAADVFHNYLNQALLKLLPQPSGVFLADQPTPDKRQPLVASRKHASKVVDVQPGVIVEVG